jgi:hypothetical protein
MLSVHSGASHPGCTWSVLGSVEKENLCLQRTTEQVASFLFQEPHREQELRVSNTERKKGSEWFSFLKSQQLKITIINSKL